MNRLALLAATIALTGCTAAQTSGVLQSNGVKPATADRVASVLSTAVDDGTLFCLGADTIMAVPGVNVKGAKADKVADACRQARLIGGAVAAVTPVPVPPPSVAAQVPIAVTPPTAATAVAASVRPAV